MCVTLAGAEVDSGAINAGDDLNVNPNSGSTAIIQTGSGKIVIKNIDGIDAEEYQMISEELGVTRTALNNLFKILKHEQVPLDNLDSTLREIAKRYKELDHKLSTVTSEDSAIKALKKEAREALETADIEQAYLLTRDVERLLALLESPDQSSRIVAFYAIINSGRPSSSELAINKAFASSDEVLRGLAFRAAFSLIKVMEIELSEPKNPSDREKRDLQHARITNSAMVDDIKYDVKTGKFSGNFSSGQVSGSIITFRTRSCTGSLNNKVGSWRFQGNVRCGASVFEGTYNLR
jgi:archaellum component FlaC